MKDGSWSGDHRPREPSSTPPVKSPVDAVRCRSPGQYQGGEAIPVPSPKRFAAIFELAPRPAGPGSTPHQLVPATSHLDDSATGMIPPQNPASIEIATSAAMNNIVDRSSFFRVLLIEVPNSTSSSGDRMPSWSKAMDFSPVKPTSPNPEKLKEFRRPRRCNKIGIR